MCGIAGIFNIDHRPADRELTHRMTEVLSHRGPDGSGIFASGPAALGHRRLSIIDLAGGVQPMTNEDGTIHVTFNGEIYNFIELRDELVSAGHVFTTRSDTEVIVHAYEQWGDDCVKRFNGIFAFALWDSTRSRMLLARDHVGVKPLYYRLQDGRLLFGSEIKAILQAPGCQREVDVTALGAAFHATLRAVSPNPVQGHSQAAPRASSGCERPRGRDATILVVEAIHAPLSPPKPR